MSRQERRNSNSLLSRCKTFAYGQAIQARWEARAAGADEALLLSTSGELCCGASANLLVRRAGQWLTPPLASGCLPGVMRQRGLDRGLITEAPVNEADLQNSAGALLLNSLGCRPISHLGETPLEAYRKAYEADPVSIFGGIVAFNRPLDGPTAEALAEVFLEVVLAPSFSPEARAVLARKKNLRLLQVPFPAQGPYLDLRRLRGGVLLQDADTEDPAEPKVVTERAPTPEEWPDLRFAWKVVKHVRSNAITVAKGGQSLGVGAGQMNRVGSAKLALEAAGDQAQGAVLASDGFFPFDDTLRLAARHGITATIQPGGSVRDADSIAACNELGLAMVVTGRRHFLH